MQHVGRGGQGGGGQEAGRGASKGRRGSPEGVNDWQVNGGTDLASLSIRSMVGEKVVDDITLPISSCPCSQKS